MNRPLVSVIIPTHNAAKSINRCLRSIVNQTYTNIEIICCDDNSTDSTYDLICEWEKKDERITALRNKENMRAAFSRNRCIEQAKGKYIAQIDDDDCCDPSRIEKQVLFLEEHTEYDFLGTGLYYFDENGIWGESMQTEGFAPNKEVFLHGACFANPTMLYRADVLKAVNGYRVAKETRRGQDYDLHMRLYANGYHGYILPDKLTYYYRGKNSYPKCKYEYCIDEAIIRLKNYKQLGLLPKGYFFAAKPLIAGLVPTKFLERIKKRLGVYGMNEANSGKGSEISRDFMS